MKVDREDNDFPGSHLTSNNKGSPSIWQLVVSALFRFSLLLGCLSVAVLILFVVIYVVTHRDRRPQIYFAAVGGDTNSIALYLASGSNVNANIICYPFGEHFFNAPLLYVATANGQIDTVKFLINRGANPNQADSNGDTPLIWAVGQTGIARVLLDAGADINATNKSGQTALHLAGGHTDVAKLLLAAGANRSARDSYSRTPVDYALLGGYTNTLAILTILTNAPARTIH